MPLYDPASIPYQNAVCMDAACSVINVEIQHPIYGWIATSVNNADPETSVLFQRITADDAAADWVEPAPPAPEVPQAISRRQFYTMLLLNGTLSETEYYAALRGDTPMPTPLQAILDSLPAGPDKIVATGLLLAATDFQRSHPLVAVFRDAMGLTEPQVDEFFIEAAQL